MELWEAIECDESGRAWRKETLAESWQSGTRRGGAQVLPPYIWDISLFLFSFLLPFSSFDTFVQWYRLTSIFLLTCNRWKALTKLEIFHLTNAVESIYRHSRKGHGSHYRLLMLESNTGSQDNPGRRLTKTVGASATVGIYMRSIQPSAKNSLLEVSVSAGRICHISMRKIESPLEWIQSDGWMDG